MPCAVARYNTGTLELASPVPPRCLSRLQCLRALREIGIADSKRKRGASPLPLCFLGDRKIDAISIDGHHARGLGSIDRKSDSVDKGRLFGREKESSLGDVIGAGVVGGGTCGENSGKPRLALLLGLRGAPQHRRGDRAGTK